MINSLSLLGFALMLVSAPLAFAEPMQCKKLTAEEINFQRSLYEYAQVADIAYMGLSQWQQNKQKGSLHNCSDETGRQIGLFTDSIVELPSEEHLMEYVEEYVEPFKDDGGITHLVCRNRGTVGLSLSWTRVLVQTAIYIYSILRTEFMQPFQR